MIVVCEKGELFVKISTEIASIARHIGEERAIEACAKAGFDHWDFSMFQMCLHKIYDGVVEQTNHPLSGNKYLSFARQLKKVADDNGIICNQSHAPFPCTVKILDYLKRAIECTAEAGGKYCIIHPWNYYTPEQNAQMYFELLPFAKEHNIKIATENMWCWDKEKDEACFAACCNPESFLAHLNAVNDDYLVACLDIGHAEMRGLGTSAVEMIDALGDKLHCLHIHDVDQWHDSHQIPFSLNVDFGDVVRTLKKNNYHGVFTLEADSYLKAYTPENVYTGVTMLADSAKRLATMFENC